MRSRIDWKYLLGLPLSDSGFDASVLSEFRTRLVEGDAEARLLDVLLARCREKKLLGARGRQRTDSTHVLSAVRALARVECVAETMRHALNVLATVAPDWLKAHAPAEWGERYGPRVAGFRAQRIPTATRCSRSWTPRMHPTGSVRSRRWTRFGASGSRTFS